MAVKQHEQLSQDELKLKQHQIGKIIQENLQIEKASMENRQLYKIIIISLIT